MKLLRAYKTELDPNSRQCTLLAKAAGCARFAYNWGLARRIEEYKATGKSSSAIDQHKQLNKLKKTDFPWMYEVSKCAPQEALRDLDAAYQNFFRRVKNGEKPGFPRFKAKHRSAPKFKIATGTFAVKHGSIAIPRIGEVRLKEHGYIPTKGIRILSLTIRGTGTGRWFVSTQCEVNADEPAFPEPPRRTVGIDMGLKSFAVTSDGEVFDHPKLLRKAEKRLRRLQRRLSRRVKRSSNRGKAQRSVNAQHFKVACQRKDFIHNLTTSLVKTKPGAKFVVENLSVKNMLRNHKLAKSISDSGWGEFRRQLKYKTDWAHGLGMFWGGRGKWVAHPDAGRYVAEANQWFPSSKMCCVCHTINRDLVLSDRVFVCPNRACGNVIDRDKNAAINLSNYEKIVADGLWSPRLKEELPPVRREVTPVERKGRKQPRRSRNQTPLSLSSSLGCEING